MVVNIKHVLRILYIGIFISSCQSVDNDVRDVLNRSSKKQSETLSNFIAYYSDEKDMCQSAKFFVANLVNKYSIIGVNNIVYQEYMDSILDNATTVNSRRGYKYQKKTSISSSKQAFQRILDIEQLQVDSIIEHLNTAYRIWKKTPWNSLYSKDIFRKYILPYRIADEPLEYYWRADAYMRNSDYLQAYKDSSIIAACAYVYQNLDYHTNNLFWGEPLQSYSTNVNYKRGTCSDYAVYTAMVMRALGIPTTLDFVPFWGDNNNGHSFNALLLFDGRCRGYNNKEDLISGLHLSGKVPKVYRKEFEIQRNTLLYKYKDMEFIPPLFAEHNIKDVTSDYDIPVTDVTVRAILNIPQSNIAYLTVFSPDNWRPVAWGEYKQGKVLFQNIGTGYTSHDAPSTKGEDYGYGGLFLPVCYTNTEDMLPLTYPFVLQETGKSRYLIPDTGKKETIQIYRKFPRKKRIIEFAEKMKGGYFELSNQPDFSESQIVFFVDSTPKSHIQTVQLPKNTKFRYIRFYKRRGGISIGEMGCLNEKGKVIPGNLIADIVLQEDDELKNIHDGNILSYFDISGLKDTWLGLDFGKQTFLKELFFCPRTDDNDIAPGDTYELFYWDKQWVSLGKQIAEENILTYDNVPQNALLWLRNLTKGHEERPFTYENGKQIWW